MLYPGLKMLRALPGFMAFLSSATDSCFVFSCGLIHLQGKDYVLYLFRFCYFGFSIYSKTATDVFPYKAFFIYLNGIIPNHTGRPDPVFYPGSLADPPGLTVSIRITGYC